MGFGYLFTGYLFLFNFTYYHVYTDIFAALLMLLGLSTLQKYAKSFKAAFYAALPLALTGLLSLGAKIAELFGFSFLGTEAGIVLSVATLAIKAALVFFALSGVAELAKETGIPVLRLRALRNRAFTLLFYALGILLQTNHLASIPKLLAILSIFYMLFGLLCTFLNAKVLFESYIWICLEGDEDMARHESRLPFINKLNEWSDRMEQKTLERKERERREKEAAQKQKQGRNKKKK